MKNVIFFILLIFDYFPLTFFSHIFSISYITSIYFIFREKLENFINLKIGDTS